MDDALKLANIGKAIGIDRLPVEVIKNPMCAQHPTNFV
jgi:hypothetical protein